MLLATFILLMNKQRLMSFFKNPEVGLVGKKLFRIFVIKNEIQQGR